MATTIIFAVSNGSGLPSRYLSRPSEMTYIVSSGALNSTHSLTQPGHSTTGRCNDVPEKVTRIRVHNNLPTRH